MAIRGLTILLVGAACYVLAVATQNGWLYLFTAFIWSMGLISALIAWLNLRRIECSRVILGSREARLGAGVPGISEDDDLEIGIIVGNKSRIPKHHLRIAELCPLEEPGKEARAFFLMGLSSRAVVRVAYHVKCYRRGEFAFPPVAVESSGPFGIVKLRQEFPAPLSVLVYPACHRLKRLPFSGNIGSNGGTRLKARAGTLFYGSREYQRGDSLRHIHWRNSARRNTLMVKEFEESVRSSLAITFDATSNWGRGKESTLEYAVKIAASATMYCSGRGMRVHLLPVRGPSRPTGTSATQMMGFLAKLQTGDETNLSELLRLPRVPYPILAVVSLADARGLDALRELGAKTRLLIVVALIGFGEPEPPEAVLGSLQRGGAVIVLCRRGELANALSELESVNWRVGSPVGERPVG
jgi:uncharacterized protein (DUF58 family)